jgi:hypothetical protein
VFQDGSVGRTFILNFGKKRAPGTLPIEDETDQIEIIFAEGETQDINLQPIAMYPAETVHHSTEV